MKNHRVEALNQALELLERGQSPSECLATLAERRDLSEAELRHLAAELRTAAALRAAHKPAPRSDFRRALEAEVVLLASATEVEQPRVFWPRLALRALPLGLALLLSLGSVIVISADTRPGHLLHPLQPISRAIIQQLERGAGPVLGRLGLDIEVRATDTLARADSSAADSDEVDGSRAASDAAPGGRSIEDAGAAQPTHVARRGSPSLSTADSDSAARRPASSSTSPRLAAAGGIPSLPAPIGPESTTTAPAPAPATERPRPVEPDPSSEPSYDPDPTQTGAAPAATAKAEPTTTDPGPVATTVPTTAVVPSPPATVGPSPQPVCLTSLQGAILAPDGSPFPTPMQPITITAISNPHSMLPNALGTVVLDGQAARYRLDLDAALCPGGGTQSIAIVATDADLVVVGAHFDPSQPGGPAEVPVEDLEPTTELPVTVFGRLPAARKPLTAGGQSIPRAITSATRRAKRAGLRTGAPSAKSAWSSSISA